MTWILVLLLTTLGLFFRLENLSPHKFYPDSYQSLVVSQNITEYKSVVGYLGENGMLYPDFFIWTRPGYPLLINLFNNFIPDKTLAAQVVSIILGTLSIPLIYLLVKSVFKSNIAGLFSAGLLAISFNHSVWGGYIFTETTGVFLVLLFLWRLFANLYKESKLADLNDFFIGAIISYGFFTRYEYIVWIFSVILLILFYSPRPFVKIANIFISFVIVSTSFITQLFPLGSLWSILSNQLQLHIRYAGIILLTSFVLFIFRKHLITIKKEIITKILLVIVSLFALSLFLPNHPLPGVKNFFMLDPLIGVTSLVGFLLLIKDKGFLKLSIFLLSTTVVLYLTYYFINPLMQRYVTHLLPILLIPAGFGLEKIYQFAKNKNVLVLFYTLAILLVFYQGRITFNGMKYWGGGEWQRLTYEEKSSQLFLQNFSEKDSFLISSAPEAYYFHTSITTHSIADNFPFVYIDERFNEVSAIIIQDTAMRDLFPNFSLFVDQNLKDKFIGSYWVEENFHFGTRSVEEEYPVKVYKIKLIDLKNRLNANLP